MSAVASTVLILVGTVWYVTLALRGNKFKPVLASWIILGGTMTLSFATYWTTPGHSIVSNASNAVSVISSLAVLCVAIRLNSMEGKGLNFSKFQKWCLGIAAAITALWIWLVWVRGGNGTIPNVLTQILMMVGYLVTVQKLWSATKNTESLFLWWCVTIASAVALYTARISDDDLATIYAVRATVASGTIVVLMYRIERREKLALSAA